MAARVRREAQARARDATRARWMWIALVASCGGRTELNSFEDTLVAAQGGWAQSGTASVGAEQRGSGFESGGSSGVVSPGGTASSTELGAQGGAPFCDSGTTICGIGKRAFCAHLERDPGNCGQCERACSNNEYCSNGSCRAVAPCKGVLDLGGWPEVPVPTTWSHSGMALGDWNSDGVLDLAVADGLVAVNVLLGRGNGTFASPVAYPTASAPFSVIGVDLNRDRYADLVTAGDGVVRVLYGRGDGSFTIGPRYDTGMSKNQWDAAVAQGDLNGDDVADIVVASGASMYGGSPAVTQATMSVLFGAADGTLNPSTVVFTAAMGTPEIAVGDVNGDGALDLAIAGTLGPDFDDPGKLTVIYGRGDGSFSTQVDTLGLPPVGAIAISDLNRDGIGDVVLAGRSGTQAPDVAQVGVLLGRLDSTLAPRLDYGASPHWGPTLIAAELSGDGFPDVVVTGTWGNLDVLLGTGDGSFAPAVGYGSGFHPTSLVAGDVNRDGVTDLLAADESAMAVSALMGQGQGAFVNPGWAKGLWDIEPPSTTLCPWRCVPQLLADLNRDGWLDLVASQCGGYQSPNEDSLCVLDGAGDGTFVMRANVQLASIPQRVSQAELNGDAWPDLVVISYDYVYGAPNTAIIRVLLGQASGEFKHGSDYSLSGYVNAQYPEFQVVLGDVDGDGLVDMVTLTTATTEISGKVTVWRGIGDGTFREWRDVIEVKAFGSLAIGDLNLDGWADIAVTNAPPHEPGTVVVLYGRGQGEMDAPRESSIDTSPGSLSIADLNGDGWGDLVMTHDIPSAVGVLYGRESGLFSDEVEYYTNSFNEQSESMSSSSPGPMAIVDWDSDGDLDIAVANPGFGTVGVLTGHADGSFSYDATYGTAIDPNNVLMQGFASGDLNGDGRRDLMVGAFADVLMNSCR